ncbi:rRNA methyltransferase [Microlunatus endophyticus]|uniref:rRNA methyltransferase n=1 Tax=Microlunatus endophyticus TaxID=1716077 RepID=A0A917SIE5_9ACTN|nr:small ribosomal subunit Rsm22 family protein [Microlunatus endophyticus]GGL81889.1 rRNA methyltransferase [Microlunatus endophyticus]
MFELPGDLAAAVARLSDGQSRQDQLGATTRQLIERYQADTPAVPGRPIMAGDREALAYAVYRMPATYAAIRTVLEQVPDTCIPASVRHLDIAGGTGAAVWAVADRWPQVADHRVIEQSVAAIDLGRRLQKSASGPVGRTSWEQRVINSRIELGEADLITVGYLLSEIDAGLRTALLDAALASARRLLVIVEPGTKTGYRRILDARDQIIAADWQIVAPCPHQADCPLAGQERDWCHFSARLNRSSIHRRAKSAELGFEDEKFSYLVAAPTPVRRPQGRVLRHPSFPKGRVEFSCCQASGAAERVTIAKRDADRYRAARKIEWGDPWPAPAPGVE